MTNASQTMTLAASCVCKYPIFLLLDHSKKFVPTSSYRFALELPHLPDMVFHKNTLVLEHENGAKISFSPLESLKRVRNEKLDLRVSCSDEWRESRPKDKTEEKIKPFDWTFSTDYQGSINENLTPEKSSLTIDKFKLMAKETILFYSDLTLFEDELHDNGTSVSSVKIVSHELEFILNQKCHNAQIFAARYAIGLLHSSPILHES
jgi:hypothetical protein